MEVRTLKALLADWKLTLGMVAAVVAAVATVAYAFFRPAVDMVEAERKRRLHLNQIGRIAEGQIVELVEHPPEPEAPRKNLFGSGSRPLADTRQTPHRTLPAWRDKSASNAWWRDNLPA